MTAAGRALALEGGALAVAAENQPWVAGAHAVIEGFIRRRVIFTTDDVRNALGDPQHPCAMGGVLQPYITAGRIERVGWTATTRSERRGAPLRRWRAVPKARRK